jgi:hypothetical protein
MKFLFVLACSSLCLFSCVQKKKITQQLFYTADYCGGARPTPEIEAEAATPKKYAGRSVIFVSDAGRVDSARTDSAGEFRIKLRAGTYRLYESWRYYLYTPDDMPIESFDRECLKKEWEKPIAVLLVEKQKIRMVPQNNIVKFCSWAAPCLTTQDPATPGRGE